MFPDVPRERSEFINVDNTNRVFMDGQMCVSPCWEATRPSQMSLQVMFHPVSAVAKMHQDACFPQGVRK